MTSRSNETLYRFCRGKNLGPASQADCALAQPLFYTNDDVSNRTGVLLIHGFTSTPYSMRLLAEAAMSMAYQTAVPLLPGHEQQRDCAQTVSYLDWLAAIESNYSQLKQSCDRVVVVGQSLGGVLATLLEERMAGLDAMILLVPAFYPPVALKCIRIVKPLLRLFGKTHFKSIAGSVKRDNAYELTYEKIHLNLFVQLKLACAAAVKHLPSVRSNVHFVLSRGDKILSYEKMLSAFTQCGSQCKQYTCVDNSYHLISLDHDVDRICSLMRTYVVGSL
jgi:carboxylesterase